MKAAISMYEYIRDYVAYHSKRQIKKIVRVAYVTFASRDRTFDVDIFEIELDGGEWILAAESTWPFIYRQVYTDVFLHHEVAQTHLNACLDALADAHNQLFEAKIQGKTFYGQNPTVRFLNKEESR